MGQYLLGGAVAEIPYITKELNIPLYTAEELCYYIYHNLTVLNNLQVIEYLGKENLE